MVENQETITMSKILAEFPDLEIIETLDVRHFREVSDNGKTFQFVVVHGSCLNPSSSPKGSFALALELHHLVNFARDILRNYEDYV